MTAAIYYFSGTGNSYAVAKEISSRLHASFIPIPSVIHQREIEPRADCIGIVFPVYYADAPNIVCSFVSKLKGLSSKYIFAVCTYGGGKGSAIKSLKSALRDGKITASYGIHMPQNAFAKPRENKTKLYEKAHQMSDLIVKRTKKCAKGFVASEWVVDMLQRPSVYLIRPIVRNYLLKTVKGSKEDSYSSLVNRLDCLFSVNDKCRGCEICVKVCPAANIAMENGKPNWLHRCENCLACFNFCPERAIQSKIAQNDYRYIHPEYKTKTAIECAKKAGGVR